MSDSYARELSWFDLTWRGFTAALRRTIFQQDVGAFPSSYDPIAGVVVGERKATLLATAKMR